MIFAVDAAVSSCHRGFSTDSASHYCHFGPRPGLFGGNFTTVGFAFAKPASERASEAGKSSVTRKFGSHTHLLPPLTSRDGKSLLVYGGARRDYQIR